MLCRLSKLVQNCAQLGVHSFYTRFITVQRTQVYYITSMISIGNDILDFKAFRTIKVKRKLVSLNRRFDIQVSSLYFVNVSICNDTQKIVRKALFCSLLHNSWWGVCCTWRHRHSK